MMDLGSLRSGRPIARLCARPTCHARLFCKSDKAPHKNIAMICSIAGGLALEGIHLVITGGADAAVYAHQGVAQLAPNVRLLGRVDDDDLACLYRQALCLAFPSRAEGFGLPAVEAMALGCPVISSNASSLPEICGEAALYAAPDDAAGWLEAIRRIANDPMLRQSMVDADSRGQSAFRGAMEPSGTSN